MGNILENICSFLNLGLYNVNMLWDDVTRNLTPHVPKFKKLKIYFYAWFA